jgi:hypothetical protein
MSIGAPRIFVAEIAASMRYARATDVPGGVTRI